MNPAATDALENSVKEGKETGSPKPAPQSGESSEDPAEKKAERINRSELLAARRVEEARKARAERIERQRYEEPIGDLPKEPAESLDDFEDSGERKPKNQQGKKKQTKKKKNVELPGDDFEDLG